MLRFGFQAASLRVGAMQAWGAPRDKPARRCLPAAAGLGLAAPVAPEPRSGHAPRPLPFGDKYAKKLVVRFAKNPNVKNLNPKNTPVPRTERDQDSSMLGRSHDDAERIRQGERARRSFSSSHRFRSDSSMPDRLACGRHAEHARCFPNHPAASAAVTELHSTCHP